MYNKIQKKEKEKSNKKGGFLACSYNLWSLWSLPMLGDMIPLSCMYGKFLHQATRNKRKRGVNKFYFTNRPVRFMYLPTEPLYTIFRRSLHNLKCTAHTFRTTIEYLHFYPFTSKNCPNYSFFPK